MKKQIRVWFARALALCLIMTQMQPLQAQTVSGGDAVATVAEESSNVDAVSVSDALASVTGGDAVATPSPESVEPEVTSSPEPDEEITLPELSLENSLTNLSGNATSHSAKLVIPEEGSYKFETGGIGVYATIWNSAGESTFENIYLINNTLEFAAGTYEIELYTYNSNSFDVTLKRIYNATSIKALRYDNQLFDAFYNNNTYCLGLEVEITLENGSKETAEMYDSVWWNYGLCDEIYAADDLTTLVSGSDMPAGDYIYRITSSKYAISCDVPFTVVSKEAAATIKLGEKVEENQRGGLYQLKVPEDGIYQISVFSGISGWVTIYDTNLMCKQSCYVNNGANSAALKLGAGNYYVYVENYDTSTAITFAIETMPDISSLSRESEDRLEVVYGTWGYYFGTSTSGNNVSVSGNKVTSTTSGNNVTTSGNNVSKSGLFTEGDVIEGMITTTISGNNYTRETFNFDLTLQGAMTDGSTLDFNFNQYLWNMYDFVEKVYQEDGTSVILADENGYAAIGDYIVEFEAQGKTIRLPFYVVESSKVRDIRKTDITILNQIYTGEAVTPIPTVMYGEDALTVDVDYTIEYKNNIELGTATVTLTGIGAYSGVVTAEFVIAEAELSKGEIASEEELDEKLDEALVEAVVNATGCETVEELKEYLQTVITENATQKDMKIEEDNCQIIDITVMISTDGGNTWVEATPENFPEDGVEVRIPYPEGTNKDKFKFVIGHLMTSGKEAGKMEYPKVDKQADALVIKITSASPFVIAWEKVVAAPAEPAPTTAPTPTTAPVESKPASSTTTVESTPAPTVTESTENSTSPKTYDDSEWIEGVAENAEDTLADTTVKDVADYPAVDVVIATMEDGVANGPLLLLVLCMTCLFAAFIGVSAVRCIKKEEKR